MDNDLLLLDSLHDSRPMLGAGSSSGVKLFQVLMGTGLWQDGADQHVFHCLFIPIFARCLSVLVESPFLHQGFASSSYNGDSDTQLSHNGVARVTFSGKIQCIWLMQQPKMPFVT